MFTSAKKSDKTQALSQGGLHYLENLIKKYALLDFSEGVDDSVKAYKAQDLFRELKEFHHQVSSNILQVSLSSHAMLSACKETEEKTQSIRHRVSKISESTNNTAIATQHMNDDFTTVAKSTESLNLSMREISKTANTSKEYVNSIHENTQSLRDAANEVVIDSTKARDVSSGAKIKIQEVQNKVASLERASSEINEMTATISAISKQIKLLALNATIEASTAGDAGRGFAVVAKEVKALAAKTSIATQDIQEKMKQILDSTTEASSAVRGISDVIQDVDETIQKIAFTSKEQASITYEISQKISDTNSQIDEMTHNLDQGVFIVEEIHAKISQLNETTQTMTHDVGEISEEASSIQVLTTSGYASALEASNHGADIVGFVENFTLNESQQNLVAKGVNVFARLTPRFDVKVKQYNDDHGVIFDFIDQIHKLIKQNSEGSSILAKMEELEKFTIQHFAREEKEFHATNYPDSKSHILLHTNLLKQVADTISAIKSGAKVDLIEVLKFLADWLFDHIQNVDKRYSDYLNQHGVL